MNNIKKPIVPDMPIQWSPPDHWLKISTVEMHTGGEPLRIIVSGLPEIIGSTILEKRRYFKSEFDHIRTVLMYEPRGHYDMYGAVILPPSHEDADFDVLFMHNEGYSTMCGHATIALVKYLFESNAKFLQSSSEVILNAPCGLVRAFPNLIEGEIESCSFVNVPSFVYLADGSIQVDEIGEIKFDIAYGGAFYAVISVDSVDLTIDISNINQIMSKAKVIKEKITEELEIIHPTHSDLGFLYGIIFTCPSERPDVHSKNVCVFADGEVDRSATGSGVSARAAILHQRGELQKGQKITIESIIGSKMSVEIVAKSSMGEFNAVSPIVSGKAYFTGKNTFCFDPEDPYRNGFLLK